MSNGQGYTAGQCTYGASVIESWIPPGLGDADQWVSRAPSKGLKVMQTPTIGAAMTFTSSYPGSQGHGHVGIVTDIGPNGYPRIIEMNANRDGGGKGIFDSYQTTSRDVAYLAGYVVPANGPADGGVSQVTGSSLAGAVAAPITGINPLLNSLPNPDLNPVDAVLTFAIHGGEIILGFVALVVGLYFIAKSTGASVPGATIIQKLPGVAGMAAKFA